MIETAIVELYTDFASAGGKRVGWLGTVVSGSVRYSVAGDGAFTLSVRRDRWAALGGALRSVLRVTWPEGTVDEGRVSSVGDTREATVVQLSARPVFAEFGTGGPIIAVVGGVPTTRVAGEMTLSTWLTQYVLPHPSVARLGVTLGTLARNPVLPGDFDAETPGAVLRTQFDAAGLELDLVRAGETGWTLNGPEAIGSTLPPITVRDGRNLLDLAAAVDDQALAQAVVPLGEADPDTGDRATMAQVRYEITALPGSGWVTLRDPETALTPILVDTQWVGAALRLPDYATRVIVDSRTSDGSVRLASTTGLSTGMLVGLATSTGAPLVQVFDAQGGSAPRVVKKVWSTLRGEANEVTNGRFANGLTGWQGVNATTPPAIAEVARTELGLTLAFLANGTRGAGTGTGTPFAVDGLPPGARVLRGDVIRQAGSTHLVSANVIPDTSGALAFSIATGLPAAYADNDPITLVRREVATWTLAATTPLGAVMYRLTGTSAEIQRLAQLSSVSDLTITGPGGEVFAIDRLSRVDDTTALLIANGWTGGASVSASGIRAIDSVIVLSAQRLRLVLFPAGTVISGETGSTDTYVQFISVGGTIPSMPDYLYSSGGGLRINGVTVATGTLSDGTSRPYIDIDVLNLPASATFVGATFGSLQPSVGYTFPSSPLDGSGNRIPTYRGTALFYSATWASGSSFSVTHARERRTLRFDGPHGSGATSLTFKPQAALARRNWLSTDTLYCERAPQVMTLKFTAINLAGGQLTIDLANSTAQNYVDLWPVTLFKITGSLWTGSGYDAEAYIRLTSIAGTTVDFVAWAPFDASDGGNSCPVPQVSTAVSEPTSESFAITGTATWAADGTVSLPITIPSGRTLTAGTRCWSNWLGSGPTDGYLVVATTVSGPASAVTVRGGDAYPVTWNGSTAFPTAVYRLDPDSYLEVVGNTLIVAATATANGSGQANLTLTAANANTVADNAALTVTRPQLLRPTDPTTGSVIRLLSPPGTPTTSTPGIEIVPGYRPLIVVPIGTTRTVTAFVTFALQGGVYPVGEQPAIAICDDAGTVLGTALLAATEVTVLDTPTLARLILSVTLTATTRLSLRYFGGTTDPTLWAVCTEAMLCVTARDDVPFTSSSWANQLAQRGADVFALQRLPVANVTVDVATLRKWSEAPATTAPIGLGQPVTLPTLGVTRRVLTLERSLTTPSVARVEVGTVPTDLSRRVASVSGG